MDHFKKIYLQRRSDSDPLHVLPGMDQAPDVMPDKDQGKRGTFAIGLLTGHIVKSGTFYYYDPERGSKLHQIPPDKNLKLAQGRDKAEDAFIRNDNWVKHVENEVDNWTRQIGNQAAIQFIEQGIEERRKSMGRVKDENLRAQLEKEIRALRSRQQQLETF